MLITERLFTFDYFREIIKTKMSSFLFLIAIFVVSVTLAVLMFDNKTHLNIISKLYSLGTTKVVIHSDYALVTKGFIKRKASFIRLNDIYDVSSSCHQVHIVHDYSNSLTFVVGLPGIATKNIDVVVRKLPSVSESDVKRLQFNKGDQIILTLPSSDTNSNLLEVYDED